MTIAIIDAGSSGTEQYDIYCFSKAYKLPYGALTVVQPFGAAPVDVGWGVEISLDVEWAHAIAPAASILLIETPFGSTDPQMFNYLIDQAVPYAVSHGANIISMSWGAPETSQTCAYWQARSAVFANAVNAGVTLVAAAGDEGANDGTSGLSVDYPSADPHVIGVGGTYMLLDSASHRKSEVVWNELANFNGATGGGVSGCFALPAYQHGDTWSPPVAYTTVVNGNLVFTNPTMRATPDVSYDADPFSAFWVFDSGSGNPCGWVLGPAYNGWIWCPVGGTSAGAPQWAGIWADIMVAQKFSGTAAAFDYIYDRPVYGGSDFTTHYILYNSGNNGYYWAAGWWSACTGIGTPDIASFISNYPLYATV